MNNHDFRQAKAGDKVTSIRHGHGIITEINPDELYPIIAEFTDVFGDSFYSDFDFNGFWLHDDFAPTVFKCHIEKDSISINYNTIQQ